MDAGAVIQEQSYNIKLMSIIFPARYGPKQGCLARLSASVDICSMMHKEFDGREIFERSRLLRDSQAFLSLLEHFLMQWPALMACSHSYWSCLHLLHVSTIALSLIGVVSFERHTVH
jgi:hypothetical protein